MSYPIPAHVRVARTTLLILLIAIAIMLFAIHIRDKAVQNCPCLYQSNSTQQEILS